jgi:VWFA-related protein
MKLRAVKMLVWIAAAVWQPAAQSQSTAANPDDAPPVGSQSPTITSNSTLVVVPALVRTKSGQLVFTLTAKDFTLTDDGVPQKLRLEEDTDSEPLALVVTLEGGGAGVHQLAKYTAVAHLIDSVVGDVPHVIAVVGYDSSPVLVHDFTPDADAAAGAIQALIDDDNGDKGAATLDAIAFSVDLLRKQPPKYRKAILLISETLDRGSHTKLDDALRAVADTNTAIYSIAFSTSKSEVKHEAGRISSTQTGPAGGCMAKDHSADPDTSDNRFVQTWDCMTLLAPPLRLITMATIAARDGLQRNVPETIAHLTGGEYFKLTSEKSLEKELETLANHIPNRYILTFQPQAPHPGLHVLRLWLPEHSDLLLTTRRTYWADGGGAAMSKP